MYKIIMLIFAFTRLSEMSNMVFVTEGPTQHIGKRIYKEELLTDKFNDPKELVYDSASRNLYFMYMSDEIQNSGRAFVNIVTKETRKINGIEKNRATAVDDETGEVYFGSDNGLYKYDPIANTANNIGLYNVNILKLVVRNNAMYLIDANNHMLYKVINGGTGVVKIGDMRTVMEFDVDKHGNVHYVAMCGVYCIEKGHEIIKNKDLPLVYNFVVTETKTLGVTDDGVYEINCHEGTAEKVANMSFTPKSITFGDYGEFFYSKENSIHRLKPIISFWVFNLDKFYNRTRKSV